MSYDAGLVARIADALAALGEPGMRQKGIFSGRGFMAGSSAFVIAWGDGMIVKTPPDEYGALLTRAGVTPFAPDGGRPMGTWVVVAADVLAEDPELAEWVARGLRAVRAAPGRKRK